MVRAAVILSALAAAAMASKDTRTFAVMHFYGKGPLTTCRLDPIISPGELGSGHVHTIQGGSNFGPNSTGEMLLKSNCTSAMLKNDCSNYWVPTLYFKDPTNGSLTQVPLFYMNVYYFFEPTSDEIKAFPLGLSMVSGNAQLRGPPPNATGENIQDPKMGTINPVQIMCANKGGKPICPPNSDGTDACIGDPHNTGEAMGFSSYDCDQFATPMRADIHFPSCYNPKAGLTNYKENMAWPEGVTAKPWANCPEGYIHTPHLFIEAYWNTSPFLHLWESLQGTDKQPFLFANGDAMGFSSHADFMSGWDEKTLQTIIDTCNAGDSGMDKCPNIIGGINDPDDSCTIECPVKEEIVGPLSALPGNNPIVSWPFKGAVNGSGSASGAGAGAGAGGAASASAPPVGGAGSPDTTSAAGAGAPDMDTTTALNNPSNRAVEVPSLTGGQQEGNGGVVTVTVTDEETTWVTVTVAPGSPGSDSKAGAEPAVGGDSTGTKAAAIVHAAADPSSSCSGPHTTSTSTTTITATATVTAAKRALPRADSDSDSDSDSGNTASHESLEDHGHFRHAQRHVSGALRRLGF